MKIGLSILLLVLAAGCTAEVADCQVSCVAPDGPCPNGLTCVAGMCRSEGESAACQPGTGDDGGGGRDDGGGEVADASWIDSSPGIPDAATVDATFNPPIDAGFF
jgi:hypothetical protein